MTDLDRLLSAVGAAPALPGARCRHRSHLFDEAGKDEPPGVVEERHAQALGLCRICPALASCSEWFDSLPAPTRPTGVVAGIVNKPIRKGI